MILYIACLTFSLQFSSDATSQEVGLTWPLGSQVTKYACSNKHSKGNYHQNKVQEANNQYHKGTQGNLPVLKPSGQWRSSLVACLLKLHVSCSKTGELQEVILTSQMASALSKKHEPRPWALFHGTSPLNVNPRFLVLSFCKFDDHYRFELTDMTVYFPLDVVKGMSNSEPISPPGSPLPTHTLTQCNNVHLH